MTEHHALLYRDDAEYVDGVDRFVAPAFAAGETVAVAVPPDRGALLRDALDGPFELIDMTELGRNPGRIIPAVQERLGAQPRGRTLTYVGEPIWAGRTQDEIHEATRHEALINLAFAGAPIRVLCPYDVARLDPAVLEDAACTHPHVVDGADLRASATYVGEHALPARCDAPLAPVPRGAATVPFDVDALPRLRRLVAEHAAAVGLAGERAAEIVLAVSELAGNTIRHAGGEGVLHVWHRNGRLTCEVRDDGHITDPLAGRRVPTARSLGARGLWLVHQLCDLVQVRTGPAGTVVRVHASIPAAQASAPR